MWHRGCKNMHEQASWTSLKGKGGWGKNVNYISAGNTETSVRSQLLHLGHFVVDHINTGAVDFIYAGVIFVLFLRRDINKLVLLFDVSIIGNTP